jgi:hypothetical protein
MSFYYYYLRFVKLNTIDIFRYVSAVNDHHARSCDSTVADNPPQSSDLAKLLLTHSSAKVSLKETAEQIEKMNIPVDAYKKGTVIRSMHIRNEYLNGNFSESFQVFESYLKQLIGENPGSVFSYQIHRDVDGNSRFGRFAIVFKPEINMAIAAKPIISLDGGYMKHGLWGSYQVLVCGTQDGEGRDCSIGMALCPEESERSYGFFLKTMKKDPLLKEFLCQKGLVVTSDRAKGLLKTVQKHLPNSYHRYCALHLLGNIKGGRSFTDDDRTLYWKLVYSSSEQEFKENMEKLSRTHKEAHDYLNRLDPKYWSNWAFPGPTWGHVTNNLSERAVKFIGCDNDDGRKQPILEVLQTYCEKVNSPQCCCCIGLYSY